MRTLLPHGEMEGDLHPAKEGQALDLKDLQNQLRLLATLPADPESPFLSLCLEPGRPGWRLDLEQRLQALRSSLRGQARADFELALGQAQAWMATQLRPETRGLALYARAGRWPHLQGLQFGVPLAETVSAGELPALAPLVELKDDYDRYVVLVVFKQAVRILEVSLGSVTRELWSRHPHLRERAGESWGRRHWSEGLPRAASERFWEEKIHVLDRLMQQGGHSHLVLAGEAGALRRVRALLPKHLGAKVFDLLAAPAHARVDEVVQETLAHFLEKEEQGGRELAEQLLAEVRRDGLGSAGLEASLQALRQGAAETLVLLKSWKAPAGWACRSCGEVRSGAAPAACPACGDKPRSADLKEELLRLAQARGAHVEAVAFSPSLEGLGGLGCLLRFKPQGPGAEAGTAAAPPARRRHFAA